MKPWSNHPCQNQLAVKANIGAADVKSRSGGRNHKPRNLAKSVTVE